MSLKEYVLFIVLLLLGVSCNQEDRYLKAILASQKESNEKMIAKFTKEKQSIYGKDAFGKVEAFHQSVLEFIDSLDRVSEDDLKTRLASFERRALSPKSKLSKEVVLSFPDDVLGNRDMVKLKVLQHEAVCLENWEGWAAGMTHFRYLALRAIVIPDKDTFRQGENVSGRVLLDLWSMIPDHGVVTFLGEKIVTKDGVGYFSFTPAKDFSGDLDLSGEITFPGSPPAIWKTDTATVVVMK